MDIKTGKRGATVLPKDNFQNHLNSPALIFIIFYGKLKPAMRVYISTHEGSVYKCNHGLNVTIKQY